MGIAFVVIGNANFMQIKGRPKRKDQPGQAGRFCKQPGQAGSLPVPLDCGELSQLSLIGSVTSDKHPCHGPQDPPPLGAAQGRGPPAYAVPSFSQSTFAFEADPGEGRRKRGREGEGLASGGLCQDSTSGLAHSAKVGGS